MSKLEPEEAFETAQAAALRRYGVDAREMYVDLAALEGRAHVLASGGGDPVVLLHGLGTPAATWAPLLAELDGFRLYTADLPGHGMTDPPPETPGDLRAHAVGFLEGLLDGLGLTRARIIGTSMGSLFALWLAMDRPGRVGPMAHVGCPALAPGTSAPIPMRMLGVTLLGRLLMRLQPPSPRQVERLAKLVNQHPLPPEIAESLLATERMPAFEAAFRSDLRALLRLRGAMPERALSGPELATVRQPCLLVAARGDPFGSERMGRRMAASLPDAELRVCEGGHAPWLNEPGRIAEWIKVFFRERP